MAFEKIPQTRGRVEQLKSGNGNNQYVRSGDYNPVIDFINGTLGDYTAEQTVTTTALAGTLNKVSGTIITNGLTTAAGALDTITITNNLVSVTSNILVWVVDAADTAGLPVIIYTAASAGSFTITIGNAHSVNALDGPITLKFIVL